MVITQRAAEALTAGDLTSSAVHFVAWFDDPIAEPLMISFSMKEVRNTVVGRQNLVAINFAFSTSQIA